MNLDELLTGLAARNIRLQLRDGGLRCVAPKGALDERLGEAIKSHKAALLKLLGRADESERAGELDENASIPVASRDEPIPLSYTQERMWFWDQMAGPNSVYNIALPVLLHEQDFDPVALRRACNALTERHTILRTVFRRRGDLVEQVICDRLEIVPELVSLSREFQGDVAGRNAELREILQREVRKPFDLSTGPLFRAVVVRLEARSHVVLLMLHHIVADGWSNQILIRELTTLYRPGHGNLDVALPPLSAQYADYAVWQRQRLEKSPRLARQLDYWIRQLRGLPPLLELPYDRPRPAVASHEGNTLSFKLDAPLSQALHRLAHEHRVSLFMLLLAVFQVMISRFSGRSDVVMGSPLTNRRHPQLEEMVGPCLNTVALRTQVDELEEFATFLARVRTVVLEAFENQDVPFERVVHALRVPRTLAYESLIQMSFLLKAPAPGEVQSGKRGGMKELFGFDIRSVTGYSKFDLTVMMKEEGEKIIGWFVYSTDLFDEATMQQMMAHYSSLLADVVHKVTEDAHTLICHIAAAPARAAGALEPAGAMPTQPTALVRAERRAAAQVEKFWSSELRGSETATPLPIDRGRRGSTGRIPYQEHESRLQLDVAALKAFAHRHDLEPSSVVIGVWAILLSRYGGGSEVRFGAIATALGELSEALPLRIGVPPEHSAAAFVSDVQARLRELVEYGSPSAGDLRAWAGLGPEEALFESAVHWIGTSEASGTALQTGVAIRDETPEQRLFRCPLILQITPGRDLAVRVLFDAGRFEVGAIERLAEHFTTLLEGVVTDAERPISQLPLLSAIERSRVLVDWNRTEREHNPSCVQELFAQQAMRTPEAVAVVHGDRRLTYGELEKRANQLARYLRERGVGPEKIVGLCAERSAELVVGLLGILKAGGAYLPLDPSYPRERLQYMLADAGVTTVLTERALESRLPSDAAVHAVHLDEDCARIVEQPSTPLPCEVGPRNLAYAIYTSGSTGRPKGVMIEHAALGNFLHSLREELDFGSTDCLLAVTTPASDIAGLEIFLPLVNGARVAIADRATAVDANALSQTLASCGATMLHATPATWRLLLDWPGFDGTGLKALCGGEALPRELARDLRSRVAKLWNLYGLTETTIVSTVGRSVAAADAPAVEPIGRPIGNTHIYIVDGTGEPAPIGVAGEIVISGAGVARGYVKRPGLTAERFVADASGPPGARMYATGDVGRWRSDGTIEYLGRSDHQVSIRGFRIDMGEIESQLSRREHVKQVVVVAHAAGPGDNRLTAYLTSGEPKPSAAELRAHLSDALPEHMVPSAFVILDALPLTPNAKVDRRALPAPDTRDATTYAAPRTPTELAVAEIWQEILQAERIGIHDNFFEIGGHSLLAMLIMARLSERLGVEVSLRTLFAAQTISELSAYLERAVEYTVDGKPSGTRPVVPATSLGLPLS